MNAKRAFQQAKPCSGDSSAGTAGRPGGPSKLLTCVRALCIVRLVGLLVLSGAANVCLAGESGDSGSSGAGSSPGYAGGPIQDPLNPQSYMAELALKLSSSDGKKLLMKGIATQKAPKSGFLRVNASPSKPVVSAGFVPASAAGSAKTPCTVPGPEKQGALKNEPVAQVPAMMVWNGLSPDNQAAQRAMEHWEASQTAKSPISSEPIENGKTDTVPAGPTAPATPTKQRTSTAVSPLNQALMSAKPGLTLWTTPTPANLVEKLVIDPSVTAGEPNVPPERTPWSLGSDLDKYRAHAVKEGARDSGQSLKRALERAGLAIGDGVNVFILGYGSDRAMPFRVNDGKGLLDEPGKVPQRAGETAISLADGLYSLADLIAFDSLPDPIKEVYGDNHPLVRPLIFTGRTVGGVWKTTEEVGNAVTWGYFDNVTGCVGMVIEDIMELVKHVGQAATNLVRAPVQLVAGKKESTERAMDWILLVPLEFATNCAQMKGFANMDDYKTAFEDKGVIGSILELGGSTFLAYRMVDELLDELDRDKTHRRSSASESETPTEIPAETDTITHATGSEAMWVVEGDWPNLITDSGIVYFDGPLPTITVYVQ